MCAQCVAQGALYVGASLAGLRVMGAHAKAQAAARLRSTDTDATPVVPAPTAPREPGSTGHAGAPSREPAATARP